MGPTPEALAMADYLIAKLGLTVDRIALAYAYMAHVEEALGAELDAEDKAPASPPVEEPEGEVVRAFWKTLGDTGSYDDAIQAVVIAANRGPSPPVEGQASSQPTVDSYHPPEGQSVEQRASRVPVLLRFGRGNGLSPWILEPRIDGYWTPWHTAKQELEMAIESADQKLRLAAALSAQAPSEAVAFGWAMFDESGRYQTTVLTEKARDTLLFSADGTLPQWTAQPVYAAPQARGVEQ